MPQFILSLLLDMDVDIEQMADSPPLPYFRMNVASALWEQDSASRLSRLPPSCVSF